MKETKLNGCYNEVILEKTLILWCLNPIFLDFVSAIPTTWDMSGRLVLKNSFHEKMQNGLEESQLCNYA